MTTTLVPCPLCGAEKGYDLRHQHETGWLSVACAVCRQGITQVSEYIEFSTDAAWNDAGKYAQGLRDEIAKLRAWLKWCLDNCDDSPEWDFGTYATDSIRNLLAGGDVPMPGGEDAALAKGPK